MERIEVLETIKQANADFRECRFEEAKKDLSNLLTGNMHNYEASIFNALGLVYMSSGVSKDLIIAQQYLKIAVACASDVDKSIPPLVVFAKSALSQVESKLGNTDKAKLYDKEAKAKFKALKEEDRKALQEEAQLDFLIQSQKDGNMKMENFFTFLHCSPTQPCPEGQNCTGGGYCLPDPP